MALEAATYLDDLNPANPTASDGAAQGDDHLRLLKAVLQATFPNIAGAVTASHTTLNSATDLAAKLVVAGATTGSATAYAVAGTPTAAAYSNGMLVSFVPHLTNTGAVTLNLNGLGARSLRRPDLSAAQAGDFYIGSPCLVTFITLLNQFVLLTSVPEARPLALELGGTGAPDAPTARTNLGLTSAATGNASGLTSGTLDTARLTGIPDSLLSANVPLLSDDVIDWDARFTGVTQKVQFRTADFTVTAAMTYGISAISAATDVTVTFGADLPAGFTHTFIQQSTGKGVFVGSGVSVVNRQGHTKTAGLHARTFVEVLVDNDTIYLSGDTGA